MDEQDRGGGDERYPCSECAEPVRVQADTCPHCGHNPKRSALVVAGLLVALGGGLSLTIVGAIFGIPLMLGGFALMLWARNRRPFEVPDG